MKKRIILHLLLLNLLIPGCDRATINNSHADPSGGVPERSLRYFPDGKDFVITNGERRFNRALYGTNTAFRIEAGDLPEFALYLPGMGGNFKFGLAAGDSSKWLINAREITARYRPGSMMYEIGDPLLKKGKLFLQVLASDKEEGLIIRVMKTKIGDDVNLIWAFGGASGQRFSRDGDIGADPESSFYLKPEYCLNNSFEINNNQFLLRFLSGRSDTPRHLFGVVPPGQALKICDAGAQGSPAALITSEGSDHPLIAGTCALSGQEDLYFMVYTDASDTAPDYEDASSLAENAEQAREELADRIRVNTPDPFINTFGGALSVAADAIWEEPSYLHGAVAWRMRLNGWRGAYAGDWLGWQDRAKMHFEGYARAQYTAPASGPNVPDPKTNLARQEEEEGISLYTSGYISRYPNRIYRPHHYDMNLVFIDQLLWHISWTGDLDFAREMWPVIKRHLAWEKRCFDGDNDGLYDAYCCIWASDALQYSGGGVTHSTAYNYRANKMAALIAEKLGEDPSPYEVEAEMIADAVQEELWLQGRGWYAENKDLLGLQRAHPSAGLWTIYHAVDAGLPDPFEAWQSLQYVSYHIPHIPIRIKELPGEDLFTLSTTSWMPYEWSINNVALAENLHMALAYWQGGDYETAFNLWKSQILESMYLGASPGNFQQLSSYDAFRGELYRDFADPVGIGARTLVEGLFGVKPDLLNETVLIEPGFPEKWEFATLETPDISIDYRWKGEKELFTIRHDFPGEPELLLRIPAMYDAISSVQVNDATVEWSAVEPTIGVSRIEIRMPYADEYSIQVTWKGEKTESVTMPDWILSGESLALELNLAKIADVYDPQVVILQSTFGDHSLDANFREGLQNGTFFIKVSQGELGWWVPLRFETREPLEIMPEAEQPDGEIRFRIRNNRSSEVSGNILAGPVSKPFQRSFTLSGKETGRVITIPSDHTVPGSNTIRLQAPGYEASLNIVNWRIKADTIMKWKKVDISGYFNDRVTNIFKNKYLSPRSPYPTLQLPVQGIGDWCSYNMTASIDDSGLRQRAGSNNLFRMSQGIPLSTPGDPDTPNILFTSLWDNYPDSAVIPLSGKASHAYLLMAGSTHHMQSRIANGKVDVVYRDGSSESLELINPDTWWPIEQDYYRDDFAFRVDGTRPPRIHLKTGEVPKEDYKVLSRNKTIRIDGGAASLLDIPLDPEKELRYLQLTTLSNDVVIGLMSITLAEAE